MHPAGGTWEDAEVLDVPPRRRARRRTRASRLHPLDPGHQRDAASDEEESE